jgi:hypothetical protein
MALSINSVRVWGRARGVSIAPAVTFGRKAMARTIVVKRV